MITNIIDVFRFDEAGKIVYMRAFGGRQIKKLLKIKKVFPCKLKKGKIELL